MSHIKDFCKYIINDDISNIKKLLNKIQAKEIIDITTYTECKLTEDVLKGEINILWFAIALRKIEVVKILVLFLFRNNVNWTTNHLGYQTLCKLFLIMDMSVLSEVKSLYSLTTELDLWETKSLASEANEQYEENELDEKLEWENEEDIDISELHFQEYINILDYLLSTHIMLDTLNTDIYIKAAYIKIYDNEFLVLHKLLKYYDNKIPLNKDYNINGQMKPIISIAIETPSLELAELLLERKYDFTDFTNTLYNASFETWVELTKSKIQKSGKSSIFAKNIQFIYS